MRVVQLPDGGWSFSPQGRFAFDNPGTNPSRVEATGLVLLTYLGAGYTHDTGRYKDVVRRGLEYLVKQAKTAKPVGNLSDNKQAGIIAHCVATAALCEAYSMSNDAALREPAHAAIKFLVECQCADGGWSAARKKHADMTTTGWALQALAAARIAELEVPRKCPTKAAAFFDRLELDGGAVYRERANGKGARATAIGLLGRCYLGAKPKHDVVIRGKQYLLRHGFRHDDVLHNFYVTNVLHHYFPQALPETESGDDDDDDQADDPFGEVVHDPLAPRDPFSDDSEGSDSQSELWKKWNSVMRDRIVKQQTSRGPEIGSWFDARDANAKRHGRLYQTAIHSLSLEVYYRHLPIWRDQAVGVLAEPTPGQTPRKTK